LAEGKTADTLIQEIMKAVPMPDQPLEANVR
jgi:MoxR-like ATPase